LHVMADIYTPGRIWVAFYGTLAFGGGGAAVEGMFTLAKFTDTMFGGHTIYHELVQGYQPGTILTEIGGLVSNLWNWATN